MTSSTFTNTPCSATSRVADSTHCLDNMANTMQQLLYSHLRWGPATMADSLEPYTANQQSRVSDFAHTYVVSHKRLSEEASA
jgi:hypothetical protein